MPDLALSFREQQTGMGLNSGHNPTQQSCTFVESRSCGSTGGHPEVSSDGGQRRLTAVAFLDEACCQ